MNFKNGKKFATLSISALLFASLFFYMPARAADVASDFTLPSVNGAQVSLSQFKGKQPVLIEFFATWCHFCQALQPKMIEFRKSIPESQLAVVAIDVGSGDSFEKVKRFVKDTPLPYTVLYDQGSKVTRAYGVEGIPHVVLVNKEGVIKYQGSELPTDAMSLVK